MPKHDHHKAAAHHDELPVGMESRENGLRKRTLPHPVSRPFIFGAQGGLWPFIARFDSVG
jgi:hypothetical protein